MENELLEMGKDFQNRIKKKNSEIGDLKKFICAIYGLVRYADQNEDIYLVELARGMLSIKIMEFMKLDPEDLEVDHNSP